MRILKKLKCVFLSAALLVCSCTFSGAALEPSSAEVKAKYTQGVVTDVYSVDIEWGSMEFEYKEASSTWNPETHKYDKDGEAKWDCADNSNKVTVTNHSNKPVNVELSYTSSEAYSDITGSFDISEKTLEAATENSDVSEAPTFGAYLTLSGELSDTVTESTVIGSATVKLSASESSENEAVDNSVSVGYIKLNSKKSEYAAYEYKAEIYKQSSNTYVATLCAETVLASEASPNTEIYINDVPYYIQIEGVGAQFTPNSTVDISTEYYPEEGAPKRKATAIEAGKTYKLTIVLNGDGTGKATLEEIAA